MKRVIVKTRVYSKAISHLMEMKTPTLNALPIITTLF